jgi:hypothetical protein
MHQAVRPTIICALAGGLAANLSLCVRSGQANAERRRQIYEQADRNTAQMRARELEQKRKREAADEFAGEQYAPRQQSVPYVDPLSTAIGSDNNGSTSPTPASQGSTQPSYSAPPPASGGYKTVPTDAYGRECGSAPARMPDHTVTGSGHIVYRYQAKNGCTWPITIRYRFDNSERLSSDTVPASSEKIISCMNYKGELSGGCNGTLVEYQYER